MEKTLKQGRALAVGIGLIAIAAGLFVLKQFADGQAQKLQTAQNAATADVTSSSDASPDSAMAAPATAAAIRAGCVSGASVMVTRQSDFFNADGRKQIAERGVVFTVKHDSPVSDGLCRVVGRRIGNGPLFNGSIALADIGPEAVVQAERLRFLTVPDEHIALAELSARLRIDMDKHKNFLQGNDATFDSASAWIVDYVTHCAQISQQDFDMAEREFFDRRTRTDIWTQYSTCDWVPWDQVVPGVPGLVVRVSLRDDKKGTPYIATVEWKPVPSDTDALNMAGAAPNEPQQQLIDRRGIGTFYFDKN